MDKNIYAAITSGTLRDIRAITYTTRSRASSHHTAMTDYVECQVPEFNS